MRRWTILVAVAGVHLIVSLLALRTGVAELGSHFPAGPSLLGQVASATVMVLGVPLSTGLFLADAFPWFESTWQMLLVLAANSMLWGAAAAFARSASCRSGGVLNRP